MNAGPRLLRAAWPMARVGARHQSYAHALVAAGVEFDRARGSARHDVESLINERVVFDQAYTVPDEAAIIRAHAAGDTVGALVAEGTAFPDGVALRVTAVAVAPAWERHGVATVLLGMVTRLAESRVIFGGCAESEAALYQRAGFDVLARGESLPLHVARVHLKSSNVHYPHWFSRSA